jgi:hypothetical protein
MANSLACPQRKDASPRETAGNHSPHPRATGRAHAFGQGLLSDEPEMEHSLHALQLLILVSCLTRIWQDRNDYFLS